MSMEEFSAQVAWQGVQPSSFGGGEASTAQEPQPEPEVAAQEADPEAASAAQEDIAEATPQASPVTTPVLELFEEEDDATDMDYTADWAAT